MPHRIASLFTGAGFLDSGFTENDFDVVWGCEIVPEFAAACNHNIMSRYQQDARIISRDITTIDIQSIINLGIRGIIGGPPCQDFSVGNANSPGVDGERGQLVWSFLHIINQVQPDFFLFENVESLYKTRRHRREALLPLLREFRNIGYKCWFRVINCLDYGIPQDRTRVFIVAFRREIIQELHRHNLRGFRWPKKKYENAKSKFTWPKTWNFGTQIDEAEYIKNLDYPYELTAHSVIGNQEDLAQLPNNISFNPYSTRFYEVAEGDDKRKSFKRLHRFRYSPTVAYGNNEVHLHPTLPRRLTVREALRLQTVPDWYQFPEGMALDKMFKMVSNGVPYKLAELLAFQIQETLQSYDNIIQHNQENPLD